MCYGKNGVSEYTVHSLQINRFVVIIRKNNGSKNKLSWKGLMNDMKHNLLEKLGVSIPQLGLGCMRLPTDNDTIDYAHAQKIVDYAMKNGVNYFDTAYMYHN